MSSMSSFTGMAPVVQPVSSNERINSMGGGAGHPPLVPPQGGVPMPGYGNQMPPPPNVYQGGVAPHAVPVAPKPFMSDEDEQNAVRELEQQNESLADSLASVETKQKALEALAEKLRDLDQLRHELVTLVVKRDKLRATSATASAAEIEDPAELQTRLAVERTLRDLVAQEKERVQKLQGDVARFESELREASLSSSFTKSATIAPTTAPLSVSGGFGGFGEFGAVKAPTPASTSASAFSPVSVNASGFDGGFGDFAGATTTSGGGSASFGDFNFN